MNTRSQPSRRDVTAFKPQAGFNLTELMVAITIGLMLMLALISMYTKLSGFNSEMSKANNQIENGRFAMQVLESDLVHAGFLGGYIPQFDDLTSNDLPALTSAVGGSLPTSVPDPCLAYSAANWTAEYKGNLLAIPVQVYPSIPANCALAPASLDHQKPNTDVLVVRHLETCEAGVGGCDNTAGKLYFQSSMCESEISGDYAQGGTSNTITLVATASSTNDFYVGQTIRIMNGPGFGQVRTITAYNGGTKVATVDSAWSPTVPTGFSKYVFGVGYTLDTAGFTFTMRNCTTTAPKRRFVSNIYYIRDYSQSPGDGIPTLVRSQFDLQSGTLGHQAAQALIDGVEGFKVELGIDSISDAGINVISDATPANRYTGRIIWSDPENLTSPTNRGDGVPDGAFIHCTAAAPCSADQLANTVAAKLFLLVRSSAQTPGYTDNKTYYLDSARSTAYDPCVDSAGTALTGSALTACRGYKRHVYSTTVRLANISGRRETP